MKVFNGIDTVRESFDYLVVTIGNFDGVHIGHQKIFRKVNEARGRRGTSMVITFNPHPVKVLAPERKLKLLTPLEEKLKLIEKTGIDAVLIIDFDREFSRVEPEDFIKGILVDKLKVKHVIVGHNYRFGKEKRGTTELLRRRGRRYGFKLTVVRNTKLGGHVVSSSRIRQLLAWGRVCEASSLLGRPYSIHGRVIRGAGRGARVLSTPTANITTPNEIVPKEGVYAVRVELEGNHYDGVANIGTNPTFDGTQMSYEVHLFDVNQNLLGKELRVYFIDRIRGEKRFSSVEQLKTQIKKDIEVARAILKERPALYRILKNS
ncbi:MAG: bifunctional riboflavin kinase/FAD synthetase [Nitrospirae bacterium]|nr:MAG: bifunctional riboflavin kinase/FAD synthetase [Nitrospirota bacterium]